MCVSVCVCAVPGGAPFTALCFVSVTNQHCMLECFCVCKSQDVRCAQRSSDYTGIVCVCVCVCHVVACLLHVRTCVFALRGSELLGPARCCNLLWYGVHMCVQGAGYAGDSFGFSV